MKSWKKEVPFSEVKEGKLYFVARTWTWGEGQTAWQLYGEGKNGKPVWTDKAGIAVRFKPNALLAAALGKANAKETGNARIVLFEVPANADKRWKRRR